MTTTGEGKPPTNRGAVSVGKGRLRPLWIAAAAIGGLGIALFTPTEKIIFYNASPSVPRGWYVSVPLRDLSPGQLVLVSFPESMVALAAERHYLPRGVPALKRIAARPGDKVCEREGMVWINSRLVAVALAHDHARRRLRPWNGVQNAPTRRDLSTQHIPPHLVRQPLFRSD